MTGNFLLEYLRDSVGPRWLDAQMAEGPTERHPVAEWYGPAKALWQSGSPEGEPTKPAPKRGSALACYSLAADLHALRHDLQLRGQLIDRLKEPEDFAAGRYELYVAAALVRAGFSLGFDPSRRHYAFTAQSGVTGERFSVEVKRRGARLEDLRMFDLFTNALSQKALDRQMIFLDWNRQCEVASLAEAPQYVREFLRRVRRIEGLPFPASPVPPAIYLFLTNTPWEFYLEAVLPECALQAVGFNVPDFHQEKTDDAPGRTVHADAHRVADLLTLPWEERFSATGELQGRWAPPAHERHGWKKVSLDKGQPDRIARQNRPAS